MATYKTAMGKSVDMATLASKNEQVRAVGNMRVNARGDTIDNTGKIIKPVTAKVTDMYAKTVGNRGAQVNRPAPSRAPPPGPATVMNELTDIERELEKSNDDDAEVERMKAASLTPKVKK